MIKYIPPVLTDMRLLSDEAHATLADLFQSETIELLSVMVNFYVDGHEVVRTSPNNYCFRDTNSRPTFRTWKSMTLENKDQGRFSDAMMLLANEPELVDRIRDIAQSYGALPQHNYMTMTIMQRCIILSHSDLESYVAENPHCIETGFSSVDTRASICTVIVVPEKDPQTRVIQLDGMLEDIGCFRAINAPFFDGLLQDQKIELGDFADDDKAAFMTI